MKRKDVPFLKENGMFFRFFNFINNFNYRMEVKNDKLL